jgi:hypothetical protein
MESLTAFLILAALIMTVIRQDRAAVILFSSACLLVAVLLRLHASDALKLGF